MNKTTRQIVLLLGVMSFLVLIFLSFSLTASDENPQRNNWEPDNTTEDQPDSEPDTSPEDNTNPEGLMEQSAHGLQMLIEDFISGIAFFI